MHKDNTPIYNVNRQVVNFKDFHPEEEKPELDKIKKSYKKNELEKSQKEKKYKFNNVTRKLDDLDKSEIENKLGAIEEGLIKENIEEFRKEAEDILHSCEKYFMEDGPNSMDTVISLSDAIDAITKYLIDQDYFNNR